MSELKVSREDFAFVIRLAEELAYDAGYRAGWQAASRAVNNSIAEACQGIPSTAAEVVARLVRDWDRGRRAA